MEKIDWLIRKLQRQHEAGANAAEMLATLQLLQNELNLQIINSNNESKSITVVMPSPKWNMNASDDLAAYETETFRSADEEKLVFELEPFVHYEAPKGSETLNIMTQPPETHTPYLPEIKEEAAPVSTPQPVQAPPTVVAPPVQASVSIPPSVAAVEMKSPEIHADKRSLNDLLEKPVDELFTRLHEPIKDLKKAISINDRFQYITNLFSGDETMYDRSIKTINNFNVLSEAEYWIRRELAVKHGWKENDPLVKAFYQLVSRRFS